MTALRLYRLINTLSLDVVAGAIVNALFFAKIFDVYILPYGIAALALSVWIIYTADHLWDARKIATPASSVRHRFHQKYFRVLSMIVLLAVACNVVMILFIRPAVLLGGVILIAVIGIYLWIQRHIHYVKEIFVACLYVMGVLLPSLAVTLIRIGGFHAALIAGFFLVCMLNLYIFSWFGADSDVRDRLGSFVSKYGKATTGHVIWGLFILAVAACITALLHEGKSDAAIYPLVMSMMLMAIFLFPRFFSRDENYRLFGDAIFLIPVMYLL
jgi:hypothetical protein